MDDGHGQSGSDAGFTQSEYGSGSGYGRPAPDISIPAVASMVLGILGLVGIPCFGLFLIFCVPMCSVFAGAAVVLGHVGRSQIRANPERYIGEGFAVTGLILGYITLALTLAAFVLFVVLIAFGALNANSL